MYDSITPEVERRFWAKVDRSAGADACWPWLAGKFRSGYGRFNLLGRMVGAHRVALTISLGRDVEDCALHLPLICHNRSCCNGAHLYEGSRSDNAKDAITDGTHSLLGIILGDRSKAVCPSGHPYSDENTRRCRDSGGGWARICRECERVRSRDYQRRKRAGAMIVTSRGPMERAAACEAEG